VGDCAPVLSVLMLNFDKPKIDVWVSTSVTPRPRDPADHPIQPCSKTKPTVDVSGLGKSNISKHSQPFCVSSAPSPLLAFFLLLTSKRARHVILSR